MNDDRPLPDQLKPCNVAGLSNRAIVDNLLAAVRLWQLTLESSREDDITAAGSRIAEELILDNGSVLMPPVDLDEFCEKLSLGQILIVEKTPCPSEPAGEKSGTPA